MTSLKRSIKSLVKRSVLLSASAAPPLAALPVFIRINDPTPQSSYYQLDSDWLPTPNTDLEIHVDFATTATGTQYIFNLGYSRAFFNGTNQIHLNSNIGQLAGIYEFPFDFNDGKLRTLVIKGQRNVSTMSCFIDGVEGTYISGGGGAWVFEGRAPILGTWYNNNSHFQGIYSNFKLIEVGNPVNSHEFPINQLVDNSESNNGHTLNYFNVGTDNVSRDTYTFDDLYTWTGDNNLQTIEVASLIPQPVYRTTGESGDRLQFTSPISVTDNEFVISFMFQTSVTTGTQTFMSAYSNNRFQMNANGSLYIWVSGSGFTTASNGFNDGLPHEYKLVRSLTAPTLYELFIDDVSVGTSNSGWGGIVIQQIYASNATGSDPLLGEMWDFYIERSGVPTHALAIDEDFSSTLVAVDSISGNNASWLTNKTSVLLGAPPIPTSIDGGIASTTVFDTVYDGGLASTTVFEITLDGGTA